MTRDVRDALALLSDDYAVRDELLTTDRHAVYEVDFGGRHAVCKLALTDDPTGLYRDTLVLRRVADSSAAPVPDLLVRGENCYVASYAPGGAYDGDAPREVREGDLRTALRAGYESIRPLPDGFDARRAAYRAALTLKPLRKVAEIGTRADVPADELGETMASFVRDRLDAARKGLR